MYIFFNLDKSQREADAKLYNETQAALGVKAVYQAQASGLKRLATSFGGKGEAMVSYLMLEQNLFEKLAQSNADAIKGLKPKVTVWKDCGNGETASNPIHDIFGSLPPLLDGIHAQTGVKAQNF